MANQKKRTAWSVQDVVNGRADIGSSNTAQTNPRFKSGYSGPKKPRTASMDRSRELEKSTGVLPVSQVSQAVGRSNGYSPIPKGRMNSASGYGNGMNGSDKFISAGGYGLFDYAWIVFTVILGLCLTISLVIYGLNSHKADGYRYPTGIFTISGVVNEIFDDYKHGGLGSAYNNSSAPQVEQQQEEAIDTKELLGEDNAPTTLPNSTTGATMALDTGGTYGSYGIAASYDELITQLSKALEANDFGFVGMKLSYKDESTGNLIGYPQSVVEHFTKYMSDNTGKREIFLNEIKDEDTYMVKNGSAYLVLLPQLAFTINMGYDNTVVSVSGFSDQVMNAKQSATVSPLLPCMYTITVTTDGGSQSSDVECDMAEGNLEINIGVAN